MIFLAILLFLLIHAGLFWLAVWGMSRAGLGGCGGQAGYDRGNTRPE